MKDHVHMMASIQPKYAVSQVLGYMKGKSAIHLARVYGERKRGFIGQHFWARVFRFDGRSRQNHHPGIHQKSGARGPEAGAVKPLALNGHL